jgi:hypothetical protein
VSTPGELEKYARPRWESNLRPLEPLKQFGTTKAILAIWSAVCVSCKIFIRWRFYLFLKTEKSRCRIAFGLYGPLNCVSKKPLASNLICPPFQVLIGEGTALSLQEYEMLVEKGLPMA